MGVSISYSGSALSPATRSAVIAAARAFATDMEWSCEDVQLRRVRGSLAGVPLETPEVSGVLLRPHVGCEPMPLLFLQTTGTLVEAIVDQDGEQGLTLSDWVLVKTQFAPPATHQEICECLRNLRREGLDLHVDDESGFYEDQDEESLRAVFDQGWDSILASVADEIVPGAELAIGGLPIRVPFHAPPRISDANLTADCRTTLSELGRWLQERYGGLGLDFEPSDDAIDNIENLDLLMLEADREEWFSTPDQEDNRRLFNALGAAFGQAVATALTAEWVLDPDEGMLLENVGGVGIRVDPFRMAAERISFGPSHGFCNQFGLVLELAHRLQELEGVSWPS